MGIRCEGLDEVIKYIKKQADKVSNLFIDDLDYVGSKVVTYIRHRGPDESWVDQTGNLRSSIGYVIVKDGEIVRRSGFGVVNGPKRDDSTEDGSRIGLSYAEQLSSSYTKGYALIIVAGMNYASYVEAIDSKDVLASGEIEASKLVAKLVDDYNRMVLK